jgi:hypothetical protein
VYSGKWNSINLLLNEWVKTISNSKDLQVLHLFASCLGYLGFN